MTEVLYNVSIFKSLFHITQVDQGMQQILHKKDNMMLQNPMAS